MITQPNVSLEFFTSLALSLPLSALKRCDKVCFIVLRQLSKRSFDGCPEKIHCESICSMGFLRNMAVLKVQTSYDKSSNRRRRDGSLGSRESGTGQDVAFSDRFTAMVEHCQKRMKQFHGPVELFNLLLAKARRKEKDPTSSEEPKLYLAEPSLELHISEADLRQIVELPDGLDLNEWLASHTLSFFEHVNLLCGAVSEYCTSSTCPDMIGPGYTPFLWIDEKGKKIRLPAPQYIDYATTFVQKTVNDESVFPTKFGHEFPSNFDSTIRRIHRLLFHCIAHLYHSHYREIMGLGSNVHLHCVFSHLILFSGRYHLIEEKETEILNDLIVALRLLPPSEDGQQHGEVSSYEGATSACSRQPDEGCDEFVKHRRSDSGTSRGSSCGLGDSGGRVSAGDGPNLVAATGI